MWTLENDDNGGKKTKTWVVETDGVRTLWASLHFKRDQTTFWGNTFLVDLLLHMAIWVSLDPPRGGAGARVACHHHLPFLSHPHVVSLRPDTNSHLQRLVRSVLSIF